ncbi:MAG: DUF493 domain-containing protein [Zoogloeaceae bacterium]|jgi:putative lipoic acid-binding regulatory protein|nr:DUF493 domain-containing protein [Zoogloeaceae bacterium]
MSGSSTESLLEFPARFPLKIMGRADTLLETAVLEITRRHDATFDAATVERRVSAKGNYLSLTCTVTASSREMLDALYRELTAHPLVRFVL